MGLYISSNTAMNTNLTKATLRPEKFTRQECFSLFRDVIAPLFSLANNANRYYYTLQATDLNNEYPAKLLEELTGYKVEYYYYGDENVLMMEMSSGEANYDLVQVEAPQFQTLLGKNAIKDMRKAVDKYPEILENLYEPVVAYASTEDGGFYSIVDSNDATYGVGLNYRSDIFAEHGYEEPATIQEFHDLLVKIKEDTGLIPFTGNSAYEDIIGSAFGLTYNLVLGEDGKVTSYLYQPGMKEYLAWMRDAYAEGLIDPEYPVNTSATITEKMGSGKAVITRGGHWTTLPWVTALQESGDEDAYFKSIIPLEDANGTRHIACSNGVGVMFVMPRAVSDERTEYVMGMVNERLKYDTYWTFNIGITGTHHTIDEDGIPHPIFPAFTDGFTYADKFQIGRNKDAHPIAWMARVQKSQCQWDTFYDINYKASAYPLEGNPLAFASFPAYAEYNTALTKKCNDYFMQVIAGAEDLDATYDDFVKEWEEEGGLELLEGAQEWLDANPKMAQYGMQSYSPYAKIFGYDIK